jgi:hypothetical protein
LLLYALGIGAKGDDFPYIYGAPTMTRFLRYANG